MEYLIGTNGVSNTTDGTTQVYKATHTGAGLYLPFATRSFISFSYGGKNIEDFGLIAVTDGDRLTRNIYANFEDTVESYEVVDGQFYWGTHFTSNELTLNLATDGITDIELDKFKAWFAPGVERELILAEHPNRAILARVSAVPELSIIPFQHTAKQMIAGVEYTTDVTLYRGEITLTFIMDDPFWYAKYNLISPIIQGGGANGIINISDNAYVLRDLVNNIAQAGESTGGAIFLLKYKTNSGESKQGAFIISDFTITNKGYWYITGKLRSEIDAGVNTLRRYGYPDDKVASGLDGSVLGLEQTALTLGDKDFTKVVLEDNIPFLSMIQERVMLGGNTGVDNEDGSYENRVYNTTTGLGAHVRYFGFVGLDTSSWEASYSLSANSPYYLFYSGTAPSKPIIEFNLTPEFNSSHALTLPRNSYNSDIATIGYNYIQLNDKKFYFTTPALLTGYSQALNIVNNLQGDTDYIELLLNLKEQINEYYVRAWAVLSARTLTDLVNGENYVIPSGNLDRFKAEFRQRMRLFLCEWDSTNSRAGATKPIYFSINSKSGTAIATYQIRCATADTTTAEQMRALPFTAITENVGDMARSDYLIIEGRDYPNSDGYITHRECHVLTVDSSLTLDDAKIIYQNYYL